MMNQPTIDSTFGLLASGTSRLWDVSIDESLDGNDAWLLEIESPNIYVTCHLTDLKVVSKAIVFLTQTLKLHHLTAQNVCDTSLKLGRFGQATVLFVRDNEDFVRCFLVIGTNSLSRVRISLLEDDVKMLLEAFLQVQSEL